MKGGEPNSAFSARRRRRRPIPILLGAIFLLVALNAYDVLAARFWPHTPGELNLLWHLASGVAAATGAFVGATLGHWIDGRLTPRRDEPNKTSRE